MIIPFNIVYFIETAHFFKELISYLSMSYSNTQSNKLTSLG